MSAQTFFGPALGIGAMFFAGFFILDLLVKRGTTKSFDIGGIKGLRVAGTGVPKIGARWAPVMRGLTQLGGPVVRYAIAM
jgi:hypothetical protein